MRLDAGLKIGCFDSASFLRFGDFEGRAKRKMFDFVLPRGRRKRRVTDIFHCDGIRDCPFILILRSLEKSSSYHILGQTSECAILRLDGAFVLFSIGLSFERLSYERPLDNLRDWSDREHGRTY
jgi:hypothetical protein